MFWDRGRLARMRPQGTPDPGFLRHWQSGRDARGPQSAD